MKAVFKVKPEPGVEIVEVGEPNVSYGEALIEVCATGICGSDLHVYEWSPARYKQLSLPVILGHEFSGKIVEIKNNTSSLQVGDRVTVSPHIYCKECYYCVSGQRNLCEQGALRIGFTRNGAFARYISVPVECVYKLPNNITLEEAALTEPLCVGLHAIELSSVKCGDAVAVLGPGPIGLLLLLTLKAAGVTQLIVTGKNIDKKRLEFARELGADIVNVDEENPVKVAKELTDGLGVNTVFDATGSSSAVKQGIDMVRKGGEVILIGLAASSEEIFFPDIVRSEKILRGSMNYNSKTWSRAINLYREKKVMLNPLITHRIRLDDIEQGFQLVSSKNAVKVIVVP